MTAKFIPVDPFDLVVFGGTGDLALRKLLPGLYHRFLDEQIPAGSRIIGAARTLQDSRAYRKAVHEALLRYVPEKDRDRQRIDEFLRLVFYETVDAAGETGWQELTRGLDEHRERIRVFYMSTGPNLFGPIALKIAQYGLATGQARVVLEKPLGHDSASAEEINALVGRCFEENQIFRIDHYLGKETVQNLISLRFANILFEPVWNSNMIDHVQITVAEDLGLGSRAGYYDRSGALRDMVQNHILQLLCLVAMEPPAALSADAVRDEKLKILRALRPIDASSAETDTVRGQYRAGAINGEAVPGYADELGANDESDIETFVAIKAEVENWRWAGVPFYLRTGKRLAARQSDIVIQFKPVPHSIFGTAGRYMAPNRLVLRLQPDEGVKLFLTMKDPGPGGLRLRRVPLNLGYAETFTVRYPDAYERLLMDVVRGNPTLFMRKDEVTAAWAWIDPILEAWAENGQPARPYTAGSWGPSDATALLARDGRAWIEDAA